MRYQWIIGCALLLGACREKGEVVCLSLSGLPAGGAGGEGGNTTTTSAVVGGGGAAECSQEPAFEGWPGCFDSSAMCCAFESVDPDKVCYVKTLGKYIHPIFCDELPPIGGDETDHHVCKVVSDPLYSCTWGDGTLICCD